MVGIVGIAFNLHFCSGKLSTVAINAPAKGCKMCAKLSEKDIEDGCCKTEEVEVKVKDDHQLAFKNTFVKAIPEFLLPQWLLTIPEPTPIEAGLIAFVRDIPPDESGIPIHIKNCTYRI